jgi:hypothetical protein
MHASLPLSGPPYDGSAESKRVGEYAVFNTVVYIDYKCI